MPPSLRALFQLLLLTPFPLALAACRAHEPPRGPEETCVLACKAQTRECSDVQCRRGCNLVLDRLLEHEGDKVIECISKKKTSCEDAIWAECAAWIGPHADGGPPPVEVPEEEEE